MKGTLQKISALAALSSILSACIGICYTNGGMTRIVSNIYNQQVTLYGDGIYANDSLLKAGATKGTDVVTIIACFILLLIIVLRINKNAGALVQSGLLLILLYANTCLVMGVSYNRLFLLYVLQFGSSLFAFALSLREIDVYKEQAYERSWKGTGIFIIVGGCSTLLWLLFILPTIITGQALETIEIYTTEPAFAIDLAIVFPSLLFCGIMLLKKRRIGVLITPVLLIFLTGVGACVVAQTIFQRSMGIMLPCLQWIVLVGTFVILGIVAMVLATRLLKLVK